MLKIKADRVHSGPKITVGLPVYNGEKYLPAAIKSILDQDFRDMELIISDNASEDRTANICEHFANTDSRVKYYRYPKNRGSGRNFTRLVEASTGEYCMWVGSDDLRERTMITECLAVLEKDPSVVLCYPGSRSIDGNGKPLGNVNDYVKVDQETPKERFLSILWTLDLCNVLYGVIRADALRQIVWADDRSQGPDHVILSGLALLGKFIQIPSVLLVRRFHPDARNFANLDEYNRFRMAIFNPGNKDEGITMPFSEFAFETLKVIKHADLSEEDKGQLIAETLRCFRIRWGQQVIYEIKRAVELIHRGEFRRTWDEYSPIDSNPVTEQYYASIILARLEMAFLLFPDFPGLLNARAICLEKLGRLDETQAIMSIKSEQILAESNVESSTQ